MISALGISMAFMAFLGMWQMESKPSFIQQNTFKRIKAGESLVLESDFANTYSGNLQNEGIIQFKGNVTNYGKLGCGNCKSGTFRFDLKEGKDFYINGSAPLVMHKAIFEGEGKVLLKNKLEILDQLVLDTVILRSDKEVESYSIHFKEAASYEFISQNAYLDTWIVYTGQGQFGFPLGGPEGSRKVYTQGKFSKSQYSASYISVKDSAFLSWERNILSAGHHLVAECGIWMVKGKEETNLVFDYPDGFVHGYKEGKWYSMGAIKSTHGLSTEKAIIPDEYEAFCLLKSK
ncbi:MAG: hypothetical protein MRZ79_15860 [Bacteroidia bacterium]|nr:hypothetical protein [Bacteroidia bacterium]